MARPRKCRRVCAEPAYSRFIPDGIAQQEPVVLTVDEYEVIRLIDLEKRTHEQCALQMDISRTTVTEMYETARQKIADSIVNGRQLLITGGHYRFCDGSRIPFCQRCCQKPDSAAAVQPVKAKGETEMRIAVTYDNGQIFQHFGHTEQFKLYDVEDGKITKDQVVGTNGQGHGALSGFLKAAGVDMLICGGIGGGAQTALAEAGIQLFGGVSGSADDAVNAYLAGNLSFNPNVHCNHHGHEGHGSCGEHTHGCGGH